MISAVVWLKSNNEQPLKRIAELIAINSMNLALTEVGTVTPSQENRYGRKGLTVPEAVELQYLRGFMEGMLSATQGRDATLCKNLIQREINGNMIEVATVSDLNNFLNMKF